MRPVRLEMAGFGAFLEPTVIDFTGVDLFALVGPTGAGKSTVLDAIAFALYGSVARYDNPVLVAPAVAARRAEARVRLDFTVGEVAYTAVRVVKRTATGGASTRDARLERGDDVLASDAKSVSQEVERLLGLSFDDFTRCVVLPQGAFSRFLHDKPRVRQEVLVGLLGLSVYNEVRTLAVGRHKAADQEAGILEGRLGDLASATDEAIADAHQRVEILAVLASRVAESEPILHSAADQKTRLLTTADEAEQRAIRLAIVHPPSGVAELTGALLQARSDRDSAAVDAENTAKQSSAARADLEAAGDRAEGQRGLDALSLLDRLQQGRVKLAEAVESDTGKQNQTAVSRVAARDAATAASRHFEVVQQANRAHALAGDLAVGQPCPVCNQNVSVIPPSQTPKDFAEARAAVQQAAADLISADQAAAAAERAAATGEATLAAHDRQLGEAAIAAWGTDRAQCLAIIAAATAAEGLATQALRAETESRQRDDAARRRFEQARESVEAGWQAFDRVRDTLAGLTPPTPARADLAADWGLLAAWAAAQAPAERLAAERARRAATEADRQAAEHRQILADLLAAHGVVLGLSEAPSSAVAAATGRAEATASRLLSDRAQARELHQTCEAARLRAGTARLLAVHLDAGHFEKWLLKEALDDLVEAATVTLRQLSGDAYSLTCDDKLDLSVIDHANADERRPVRTLSGGETFLASLSLALALADRIAALAPGQVALESLFLDEGFGTLDPDTLDTVASAIEQLGAQGRMVGLVTHVRDLADRVPTRFEVTKGPGGATIERVMA